MNTEMRGNNKSSIVMINGHVQSALITIYMYEKKCTKLSFHQLVFSISNLPEPPGLPTSGPHPQHPGLQSSREKALLGALDRRGVQWDVRLQPSISITSTSRHQQQYHPSHPRRPINTSITYQPPSTTIRLEATRRLERLGY